MITTPECRSTDTAFLTTLALCMKEQCEAFNVEAWRLEKYWITKATGDAAVVPKWSWAEAVEAAQTPSRDLNTEEVINGTMAVPVDAWNAEKRSLEEFERQETLHSRYG